jgi:hypothetical protein
VKREVSQPCWDHFIVFARAPAQSCNVNIQLQTYYYCAEQKFGCRQWGGVIFSDVTLQFGSNNVLEGEDPEDSPVVV